MKYEKKNYSTDIKVLEENVDFFSKSIVDEVLKILNDNINRYQHNLDTNYEYLIKVKRYNLERYSYRRKLDSKQIEDILQNYIDTEFKDRKNKDTEELIKCQILSMNYDIIDDVIQEVMSLVLDNSVVEAKNWNITARGMYLIRAMNGLIPNNGTIMVHTGGYTNVLNNLVRAVYSNALERAALRAMEEFGDLDDVNSLGLNSLYDELMLLESEKKELLKQIDELDEKIGAIKQKCLIKNYDESEKVLVK